MSAESQATKAARPITPISTHSDASNSASEPSSPTSPTAATGPLSPGSVGSKPCSICAQPRNVLIRCQIDDTGRWKFVCPDTCWQGVSGGADAEQNPSFYRYGGTWKNRHELVSAKIKGVAKDENSLGHTQPRPYKHTRKMSQKDGRELRAFMSRRMSVDDYDV